MQFILDPSPALTAAEACAYLNWIAAAARRLPGEHVVVAPQRWAGAARARLGAMQLESTPRDGTARMLLGRFANDADTDALRILLSPALGAALPRFAYWTAPGVRQMLSGDWAAALRARLFGPANPFAFDLAPRLGGARATLLALSPLDDADAALRAARERAGPIILAELPPYRGAAPRFASALAADDALIWLPRFRHIDAAALHLLEYCDSVASTHAGLALAARALGLSVPAGELRVSAVGDHWLSAPGEAEADAGPALCAALQRHSGTRYAPASTAAVGSPPVSARLTRANAPPPRPARDAMRRARSIKGIGARAAAEVQHFARARAARAPAPDAFRELEAAAARQETHDAAARPLFVIVHAFHLDVFADILNELRGLGVEMDLTVTCTADRRDAVLDTHARSGLAVPMRVVTADNHGRDVLPFLYALLALDLRGDDIVLKLHTKKSTHMTDGDEWRDVALHSLTRGNAAQRARAAFAADARLGVVAPVWCKLPIESYLWHNRARIEKLLERLAFAPIDTARDAFAGGTMFYARYSTLAPTLSLNLRPDEFEPEAAQIDGTLAHALERIFSLTALRQGLALKEIGEL